ncbi:MAG: hypothetical protein ACRD27_11545 [Terracidiphilus sp.]
MKAVPQRRLPVFRLALLTLTAVAIHGYHLGVEDAEIYIPGAKRLLHPYLYPFGGEFFLSHERLSLFSPVLAWTARLTHLSMDCTISLWYVLTLFAFLACCWMLARISFQSARARWCSMLTMTAVLAMPAANTGLLLMDPYLTARSFSTPLILLGLVLFLERRYAWAAAVTVAAATMHTQMTLFLVLLMVALWAVEKIVPVARQRVPMLAAATIALPGGFTFGPAHGPYREALYARNFFFLSTWNWYDWLGLIAPLIFLAWFWRGNLRGTTPVFRRLSLALIPFGLLSIVAAAVFTGSHEMDMFVRLQPLRSFHLITMVFVLYLAGVFGEYAAKGRRWVIPAIVLPLAGLMFCVAWRTYPNSPHIEAPWLKTSSNSWVNTLLWIRWNTPTNAVFAVDSRYFKQPGVDVHGFRAISERSELADYYKDGGVAAMFPRLAPEWKRESNATYGLNHFNVEDFERLAREYPVTWTVIHGSAPEGMSCPYQQRGYAVCRIPHSG